MNFSNFFPGFVHFFVCISQCGIVLLAIFVSAICADVAEKLTDDKTATNAEGTTKEKRGIHFHSYSAPLVAAPVVAAPVYHSPVVYHSPIVHHAPIIHHSAPIIHHSYVAPHVVHAAPIVSHHVVSHAPLVTTVHHFKRR